MNIITIKRTKDNMLIAVNDYDRQMIRDSMKEGELYQAKITKPRNIKHLRKYWALMNAMAFHFGSTAEFWHEDCKNAFMVKEKRMNRITGIEEEHLPSIAFDKMDQKAFDIYYKQIDNHLLECGYDINELIENS